MDVRPEARARRVNRGSKEYSYWVKSFYNALNEFISKCFSRRTGKLETSETSGQLSSAALLCRYEIGCCGDLQYLCAYERAASFRLLRSCLVFLAQTSLSTFNSNCAYAIEVASLEAKQALRDHLSASLLDHSMDKSL